MYQGGHICTSVILLLTLIQISVRMHTSRLLVVILTLRSAVLFTTDLQFISAHRVANCLGSNALALLLLGSAPILIKLLWLIACGEMFVLATLHQFSTLLIKA